MKTPRQIKLKWGCYPHHNAQLYAEFSSVCGSFNFPESQMGYRILQNLKCARSNYLNAQTKAPKLANRYKKTLIKAIENANNLLADIKNTPCANIFGVHITIERYIKEACETALS